jgi:hypothetical protein
MKSILLCGAFLMVGPAHASTVQLQDYVTTDALGGECIMEENLELSFGKASILPRTCVPDPCAEISEDDFIYGILGRDAGYLAYDAFLRKQDAACPVPVSRARFTDQDLLLAVFNGSTIPDPVNPPSAVPLPSAGWALLAALLLLGSTPLVFGRTKSEARSAMRT